jgi:hypothetical protein
MVVLARPHEFTSYPIGLRFTTPQYASTFGDFMIVIIATRPAAARILRQDADPDLSSVPLA